MLFPQHTTDAGEYLAVAGAFLRRRPVEHSVPLSSAAAGSGPDVPDIGSNLWLWVEDDEGVDAAAQHTPPHGAYLSTGPAGPGRCTRWPGCCGGCAPTCRALRVWATRHRTSPPNGRASVAPGQPLVCGRACTPPMTSASCPGIPGRLRPATDGDAPLLRVWAEQFFAEAGATPSGRDEIGPRIEAGRLAVWEMDGAPVSMASVTPAQGGVSRVALVYTPPQQRKRGFASACVASLTARELAVPGRTCMLFTDLANPTSNRIYRAVGYRSVGDAVDLRFATPPAVPDRPSA